MRVERFGFPVQPVFPEQFKGVLGANGSVAAEHGVDRAIFVTAPADALGVFGLNRDLFRHVLGRGTRRGRVQDAVRCSCARIRVVAPHSSSRL